MLDTLTLGVADPLKSVCPKTNLCSPVLIFVLSIFPNSQARDFSVILPYHSSSHSPKQLSLTERYFVPRPRFIAFTYENQN